MLPRYAFPLQIRTDKIAAYEAAHLAVLQPGERFPSLHEVFYLP